jgi:hypothetical protein
MVRGFGLLLVAGIVLAFACAMTAGIAMLALSARRAGRGPRVLTAAWGELSAAGRGAVDLLRAGTRRIGLRLPGSHDRPLFERVLDFVIARPRTVLAAALALAVIGWIADAGTRVVSDIQKLMPQSLPALRDLNTLQRSTGVSGEIDVTVKARDLADPKVVNWMTSYQQSLLRHYGYSTKRGCGEATLCPALSLPDLFRGSGDRKNPQPLTRQQIEGVLDAVPPYFSQAVIAPRRDIAALAFGIKLMPLDKQQQVVRHHAQPAAPAGGREGGARGPAGRGRAGQRGRVVLVAPARAWGRRAGPRVGLVLFAVRRRLNRP